MFRPSNVSSKYSADRLFRQRLNRSGGGADQREQPVAGGVGFIPDGWSAPEALGGEIADDECVRNQRREETEGRAGKQPDGPAKTREVKLVTLWTAEALDSQGRPRRDPGSISYSAAIESAAARDTDPGLSAARRVGREAERRGFGGARRRVVLGDGAAWIGT